MDLDDVDRDLSVRLVKVSMLGWDVSLPCPGCIWSQHSRTAQTFLEFSKNFHKTVGLRVGWPHVSRRLVISRLGTAVFVWDNIRRLFYDENKSVSWLSHHPTNKQLKEKSPAKANQQPYSIS